MAGVNRGTVMSACCGARIVFLEGCPDEPVQELVCACGAEFAVLPAESPTPGAGASIRGPLPRQPGPVEDCGA